MFERLKRFLPSRKDAPTRNPDPQEAPPSSLFKAPGPTFQALQEEQVHVPEKHAFRALEPSALKERTPTPPEPTQPFQALRDDQVHRPEKHHFRALEPRDLPKAPEHDGPAKAAPERQEVDPEKKRREMIERCRAEARERLNERPPEEQSQDRASEREKENSRGRTRDF
jgi:hypothetical protein